MHQQEITDALTQLGHEPVKATNFAKKIKNKVGKTILKKFPLFLVELKQKENVKWSDLSNDDIAIYKTGNDNKNIFICDAYAMTILTRLKVMDKDLRA